MDPAAMVPLYNSLERSIDYPKNLIEPSQHDYSLKKYYERLDSNRNRLFCDGEPANVNVWDYEHLGTGFKAICLKDANDTSDHLKSVFRSSKKKDPQCRFIFIHSPNARQKLRITREMFTLILTFHQVMATFLDFVFPFGNQVYAQDFHFSGFRYESHLTTAEMAAPIPQLGRCGRHLQLCLSLKSVESVPRQPDWPWSIRQTAWYHCFDLETGRSTFVVVKGNREIERRITSATQPGSQITKNLSGSVKETFALTLEAEWILCEWAGENWRWYINDLEEKLNLKTRKTLSVIVNNKPRPLFDSPGAIRTATAPTISPSRTRSWTSIKLPSRSQLKSFRRSVSMKITRPKTNMSEDVPLLSSTATTIDSIAGLNEFSFNDLPPLQYIQEKAIEAQLILKANINVLTEFKNYYESITKADGCPDELNVCKDLVLRFDVRVTGVMNDLKIQLSRLETLLRLVADRKSLLYGILDQRNTDMSRRLAEEAAASAKAMAKVNDDMREIAKKTEQETVSMRIITLVTLFFLPGTFISTLMSTDIIRFTADSGQPRRVFSSEALFLFLEISLPLMLLTFIGWGVFYRWAEWKKEKTRAKNATQSKV